MLGRALEALKEGGASYLFSALLTCVQLTPGPAPPAPLSTPGALESLGGAQWRIPNLPLSPLPAWGAHWVDLKQSPPPGFGLSLVPCLGPPGSRG